MTRHFLASFLLTGFSVLHSTAAATGLDSTKQRELARFEQQVDPKTGLSGKILRHNLHFAALLYERGREHDRRQADGLVSTVIAFQDTTSEARTFGQSPFEADSKLGDQNVALFMAPYYFLELWPHRASMAPSVARRFQRSAQRLVEAAERRWDEEVFDIGRDFKAYTNVFVMYVNTLQLGGKFLQNDRLLRKAEAQWARWFNHVAYYGIDEFTSPTYTNIDVENLLAIHEQARNPTMRQQVELVLDFLVAQQAGISHPVLKLPICGSSRDYRNFQKPGNLEVTLVRDSLAVAYRRPEGLVREYRQRQFPHEVSGRAGHTPYFYKSYQTANGGMGSMTGGNYFWQQIHCLVAVGQDEQRREVAFLPGSFTPVNGYVAQQANAALCLFSRTPATYHRTQARIADEKLPSSFGGFGLGLTTGWKEVVNDPRHLVLRAYGQEIPVYPFTIQAGKVTPVQLVYKKRDKTSEKSYHQRAADFGEYVFPDGVTWMGCWITYQPEGRPISPPQFTYQKNGEVLTVTASNGLSIRLFQHPSGELTELYEQDWRTRPLLQTPGNAIGPGAFPQQSVNRGAK